MNLSYFYFCCLAILINLSILIWSSRYRKKKCVKELMLITGLVVGALALYAASLVITVESIKLFVHEMKFICVAFFSVAYFILYMSYFDKRVFLTRRNLLLLSVVPAISVCLALTNDYHHLFRHGLYIIDNAYGSFTGVSSGTFFWIYTLYSYAIYLWGIIIALRELFATPKVFRLQPQIMIAAVLVTLAINFVSVSGLIFEDFGDATLFSFTLSVIVQFYGLVLYKPTKAIEAARSMAMNEIKTPIVIFDCDNMFMDANISATVLFGPLRKDSGDIQSFFTNNLEIAFEGSKKDYVVQISGRYFSVSCKEAFDEAGKYLGSTVSLNDITQLKSKEALLKEASTRDTLTGIPNRNAFHQRLKSVSDTDIPTVVAHVNISGMNEINKRQGNDTGDTYIQKVAETIMGLSLKKAAFCARTGDDEFSLIIIKSSEEEAQDLINEIKASLDDVTLISGLASKRTTLDNIMLVERQAQLDLKKNRVLTKAGIKYADAEKDDIAHSPKSIAGL